MIFYQRIIMISFLSFMNVFIFGVLSTQAQTPALTDSFGFPLGVGDNYYNYGPVLQYYGNPLDIVENTHYGITNPDLGTQIVCFGQPWDTVYHAGEDWYRFDKSTGKMLDTTGAVVSSVGNGKVVYVSLDRYPGIAIIIEHTLTTPRDGHDKIYSVYMHLDDPVFVSNGEIVSKGEQLGVVKPATWTGTNPDPYRLPYDGHLHWEMRYFFDGSNIYDPATNCNNPDLIAGRGYTYPQHPDDFPAGTPYVNPSEFVEGYNIYLPLLTQSNTPVPCPHDQSLVSNSSFENGFPPVP